MLFGFDDYKNNIGTKSLKHKTASKRCLTTIKNNIGTKYIRHKCRQNPLFDNYQI